MAFNYKPLWKMLIDRDIKKRDLITLAGISPSTLYQLSLGNYVAMSVLDRLCNALDCEIQDVIKHKKETEGISEADYFD